MKATIVGCGLALALLPLSAKAVYIATDFSFAPRSNVFGCQPDYTRIQLNLPARYGKRTITSISFHIWGTDVTTTTFSTYDTPLDGEPIGSIGCVEAAGSYAFNSYSTGYYPDGTGPIPANTTATYSASQAFDYSFAGTPGTPPNDLVLFTLGIGAEALDYEPGNGGPFFGVDISDLVSGSIAADIQFAPVPEPGALALFGLGFIGLAARRTH